MKSPRTKTVKKKAENTYIIQPQYLSDKAALKSALEFERVLAYCLDNGSRDVDGVLTGLNKLSITNILDSIALRERAPKALECKCFMGECYRDDLLDDLYYKQPA